MQKVQTIPLFFDRFSEHERPLSSKDLLGDNVRLAYDPNSKMDVTAQNSSYIDHTNIARDALIIRGSDRKEHDWMALEVDIEPSFKDVNLIMRFAPAERVYPRVYIKSKKGDQQIDLPDFTIGFDWSNHKINGEVFDHFSNLQRADIEHLRLAILFPNRPWFALGIASINQEVR